MRWLKNLINKLLVKEIKEQDGTLHFLRWRIFALPWLRLYLHKICLSDYDVHRHTHPWNFLSLILKGSYLETYCQGPKFNTIFANTHKRFALVHHNRDDAHKIQIMEGPVWTLVLAYGKYQEWGYRLYSDYYGGFKTWVQHARYRAEKRERLNCRIDL